MTEFPEYACEYARKLAERSRPFALQVKAGRPVPDKTNYPADPFGELGKAGKVPGLKQRFPDRVLIMTTETCFMTCRHCTRQGIFGQAEIADTPEKLAKCVEYVKAHPKVRDVLLSGGDVLTLSDRKVLELVKMFAELRQVEMVRVCTRALSANPNRITAKFAKALGQRKKVWVNTQFNCADEVTEDAVKAADLLTGAGIPVSCQTVLLKGVNDSGPKMLRLLQKLSAARIRPYYVFMCDPISGIERFRVGVERAREIEKYCAERIGGLAMPRFVMDIPNAKRKVPI